jgi:hypothetical protein
MSNRFTKIDAEGKPVAADATEWAAVLDERSGLFWQVEETEPMPWAKALEHPKTLAICGFSDWRLPTIEELFCLADHTKFNPAIDKAYFPKCASSWYWSSTIDASSPGDYAWFVNVYYGNAGYDPQAYGGLVRAVRARQ